MTTRGHLGLAAAALVALGGCGDNMHVAADAPAGGSGCTASFRGDLDETSGGPACATLVHAATGDVLLEVSVPVTTFDTKLVASIDLGPSPAAGTTSSEIVTLWNALAQYRQGQGACEYSAGSAAVPPGSFRLALDAIDAGAGTVRGTLWLTLYVLAYPGTDCGPSDTEDVTIQLSSG